MPFKIVGKSNFSGEEVINLLNRRLLGIEGFRLVDLEAYRVTMNQLSFNSSDLVDKANRIKVGKMLDAQLICFGSFNSEKNLITARVDFTETGNILVSTHSSDKNEQKAIDKIAQNLVDELKSPNIIAFLNEHGRKPNELVDSTLNGYNGNLDEAIDSTIAVRVKGYGIIFDNDIISARELALKDAYAKAISQGCGVKLIRETQVENLQLVRDKILTESVGYVTNYQIVDENPKSQFGYEVTVDANVSRQPITLDIERLQLMVKYLFAEPRIAVIIEGTAKNENMTKSQISTIEGQIISQLMKAGFSEFVDTQTIENEKKKLANSFSDEDAARLGAMLDANVTIKGSFFTKITARTEEVIGQRLEKPLIRAETSGAFRIIQNDTAEILYSLSDYDLKLIAGIGSTEEAAISESLRNFIKSSADNLIKGLASKIGDPIQLHLELHNTNPTQLEQFEQQIQSMPKQIMLEAKMIYYKDGVADYQIKTSIRSQELQKKLTKLIGENQIETNEIAPRKITMYLKKI
jgi:hypothetical protein